MIQHTLKEAKAVLASDVSPWHFMENVAIELAEIYGYQEVRTPHFDNAEMFSKGIGSSAQVIERDLWTVTDKQNHRWAMRAGLLVPVMKSLIDGDVLKPSSTEPQKFYCLGPVYSSAKGGRELAARQGHRFCAQAIGSSLPSLDVEVLMLACDFFNALGLNDLKVVLNSLGCKKCRAEYQQVLHDYFSRSADKLCGTCRRRYRNHAIWTMGCSNESCSELAQMAPTIYNYLCEDCRAQFDGVRTYLDELKVSYRLSPLLVPDAECCGGTVFQISWGEHVLASGCRCDDLSQMLGGPDIPAVNATIDLDLTLQAIKEANLVPEFRHETDVCLAGSSQAAVALLLPVLYALRRAGIYAELAYPTTDDSTAWEAAKISQARFVIYLDEANLRQRLVRFREYSDFRDNTRLNEALNRIGRFFGVSGLVDELRPVEVRKFSISRRQPSSQRQVYEYFEPTRQSKSDSTEAAPARHRRRRGDKTASSAVDDVKSGIETEVKPVSAEPAETAAPAEDGGRRKRSRTRSIRSSEPAAEVSAVPAERRSSSRRSTRNYFEISEAVGSFDASADPLYDGYANDDVQTGTAERTSDRSRSARGEDGRRQRRSSRSASERVYEQDSVESVMGFSRARIPGSASEVPEDGGIDAIAEISASANGLSSEQIDASLAMPEIDSHEFAGIDEVNFDGEYHRLFNNGICRKNADAFDFKSASKYDRALSAPRGRREYGSSQRRGDSRRSRRSRVENESAALAEAIDAGLEERELHASASPMEEAVPSIRPSRRRRRSRSRSEAAPIEAAPYADYSRISEPMPEPSYDDYAGFSGGREDFGEPRYFYEEDTLAARSAYADAPYAGGDVYSADVPAEDSYAAEDGGMTSAGGPGRRTSQRGGRRPRRGMRSSGRRAPRRQA